MSRYDNFLSLVQNMKDDFDRFFDKNNKTAGSRLRKGLQELKKICQDLRMEIQDIKNASLSTSATTNKTTTKPKTVTVKKAVSKSTGIKKVVKKK